jgi:hypothetical protein
MSCSFMKVFPLHRFVYVLLLCGVWLYSADTIFAQFPGPPETEGSTALHKDSAVFIAWAKQCTVTRGFQDIATPSLGYASAGDDTLMLGKAGDNGTVSLGDGGSVVALFDYPIRNGAGFDFAVFENGFDDRFLELAFVEVSSNGVDYVRFPAQSLMQTNTQIGPFDAVGDATKLHNLAGKYRQNYGTPFDLEDLAGNPVLDIQAIKYVKIIDVVGSIDPQFARYDSKNNPINDPYPTAFINGGFDIDAIGIIHENRTTYVYDDTQNQEMICAPNPASDHIKIMASSNTIQSIELYSTLGMMSVSTTETEFSVHFLPSGIYTAMITFDDGTVHKEHITIVR